MRSSDTSIDEENLDKEWVRQPKLVEDYAILLADARLEMEERKQDMDITEVEIKKSIRDNPEEYDIKKVSEDQVKSLAVVQIGYVKARRKFNRAKHAVEVLQAKVTALEHKKRALEKLVDLELFGYNRGIPSKKGREEIDERVRHSVRKRIKIGGGNVSR